MIEEKYRNRFWKYLSKDGPGGCWDWQKAKTVEWGYGVLNIHGRATRVNRISWEIHNGPIPEGMNVLHRCDRPVCCNPDHLFLGTISQNNQDMTKKERHGRMRFTHDQVRRLRVLKKKYGRSLSQQRIANWFGVCKSTIAHMMTGRNWKYA